MKINKENNTEIGKELQGILLVISSCVQSSLSREFCGRMTRLSEFSVSNIVVDITDYNLIKFGRVL